MSEAATARKITVTRVFDSPRDAVWKAWTEPAQLAHWWGAPGWTTPESGISLDLRVGGTMRLTSRSDEHGGEMTTVGTFTDLGDGRTEMTLRSTIHMTDELATQAEAGLRGAIDRLAELLA